MKERVGRGGARSRRGKRKARIERSSGGVVFRRVETELSFLLIRDPYENWGLPKGHIEPRESPAEAALREVAEETGLLPLAVYAELPTIDWFFRDRGRLVHKFCHFYLLESTAGEPVPQEEEGITECIWCSFEQALAMLTYDNARQVLVAAGRELGATRGESGDGRA